MAYNKNPVFHYNNLGGVNQKSSQYTTDITQFLDLRNLDFSTPNALQKRAGSTQGVTTGTSGPITGLYEFIRLGGASYIMASSDTAVFYLASNQYTALSTGYTSGQPFDFVTLADNLWYANGQTFLHWNGASILTGYQTTRALFGTGVDMIAPYPGNNSTGWTVFPEAPSFFCGVTKTNMGASIGCFIFGIAAYVKTDGYLGHLHFIGGSATDYGAAQLGPVPTLDYPSAGSGYAKTPSFISLISPSFDVNDGITCSALFMYIGNSGSVFRVGNSPGMTFNTGVGLDNFRFITFMPSSSVLTIHNSAFNFNSLTVGYTGIDYSFSQSFIPKYLEVNQNRIFMSGFSTLPSTFAFSEIATSAAAAQLVNPESLIEVRTNDGDVITGQKEFQGQMIIFKQKSFHKLVGDDPDNFVLVQLSAEYGCVSNKAIATYENFLMFLDEKGVVRFNGANWDIISDRVESVFRRMNLSAAIDKACAVYNGPKNQVWFGIPVDGSTQNNMTVVYDHLLDAWTFFDGFKPASFAMVKGGLSKRTAWFGDYSGKIHYTDPSFYGDNGTAITCMIQTKWENPDGAITANMFRRMFLDVNTVTGITGTINVQAFADYNSSTIKATFAIYQNQFQTRRDFGVMAKAVNFLMSHNSASLPLLVNGYSIQRRFLRNV